jgi:phosphoribosyl-AMP cyclohydrolase / phosphoribosyl-ATP pyrophosphohydrolase
MQALPVENLDKLQFNDQGLIPAIVQDYLSGEVRMMAWMNRESLDATLASRKATFYSRSRQKLWVKGEESGNVLHVVSVMTDCDADTLLVLCDPVGPSCHTGRDNCFFVPLDGESEAAPARPMIERLEAVLETRKTSDGEKSYTRSLFDGGAAKIGKKICEEAGEVVEALAAESDERVASEAADVMYHVLVGLRFRGVPWRDVLGVLASRFGIGGHVEKASRG